LSFNRKKLFDFFVKYRDDWVRRGYDTPIAKALIFKKMRQVVGGNLRMLLSGGAPLSEDAHVFIRTCLCVNVLQGYGLTETGAVACVSDEKDISTGYYAFLSGLFKAGITFNVLQSLWRCK
jgi:long-chain acyl-CoA synthetase